MLESLEEEVADEIWIKIQSLLNWIKQTKPWLLSTFDPEMDDYDIVATMAENFAKYLILPTRKSWVEEIERQQAEMREYAVLKRIEEIKNGLYIFVSASTEHL